MPPIELTQEQLDEKLCPRAGVEVISGTTSLGKMFVYVDSTRLLAHGPDDEPDCDVITRFILGGDRDKVLEHRKSIGVPEEIFQPNSTCFSGRGPVVMLKADGSTELINGAEPLTLMVPKLTEIQVGDYILKPPKEVAYAKEAVEFGSVGYERYLELIQQCPGTEE